MPRIIAPATPEFAGYTGVHPIAKGGFGASTEAGIKANLGTIDKTDTSTGGIVKIGEDGVAQGMQDVTVIADFTTIFGPQYFEYTSPTKYEITSYTPFKNYSAFIKELPETEVIIQDEYLFIPAGIELDTITLVINGREVALTRIPSGISIPTITINGFRDTTYDYLQVVASEFKSEYGKEAGSVQVQVSTTAGFTNIIKDQTVTSLQAVDGVVMELPKGTAYYVRVRLSDSDGRWSDWSAASSVTAASLPNNIATPTLKAKGYLVSDQIEVTSSASKMLSRNGVTHASSDWQISSNSGFSALVANVATSTTSLRSIISTFTSTAEVFYARTRQRNSAGQTSAWSNVVTINKSELLNKNSYIPTQVLMDSGVIGINSYFTEDNKYLYTVYGSDIAIIENKGNGTWSLSERLQASDDPLNTGRDYLKARDDIIVVSGEDTIFIHRKNNGKWQFHQSFAIPKNNDYIYGADIGISKDKKKLAVMLYPRTNNIGIAPYINIYELNTSSDKYELTKKYDFRNSEGVVDIKYLSGSRLDLSDDGKYVIFTNPNYNTYGAINIINTLNDSLVYSQNPKNVSSQYGLRAFISSDNSIVAVIAGGANPASKPVGREPTVYFYSFNGVSLTLIQELILPYDDTVISTIVSIGGFSDKTDNLDTLLIADVRYDGGKGRSILVSKTGTNQWSVQDFLKPSFTESSSLHGNRPVISRDGKYACNSTVYNLTNTPSNIQIYERQTERYQKISNFTFPLALTEPQSGYGYYIDVSGDGNRVIIGAHTYDSRKGRLFVYRKEFNNWILEATLVPDVVLQGTQIAEFGKMSSIDYSGTRITAGTGVIDSSRGKAYVYVRSGTTWSLEQTISPPDTSLTQIYFGDITCINDNGDRMIVGQPGRETGSVRHGKAFIYSRTGSVWSLEATFDDSIKTGNGLLYGCNVSISGNGTVAAVGSQYHPSDNGALLGAVFIYRRSGTTWTLEKTIKNPIVSNSKGAFGLGLHVSKDGTVIVIGDPIADKNEGVAHIYRYSANNWILEDSVTHPNKGISRDIGYRVTINPEHNVMFLGANRERSDIGAAYLFKKNSGNKWELVTRFDSLNKTVGGKYGHVTAMSDDLRTIATCAPYESNGKGGLYIYN